MFVKVQDPTFASALNINKFDTPLARGKSTTDQLGLFDD